MASKEKIMNKQTAIEVWNNRGLQNDITSVVTPEQDAYIRAVWATMPGTTCYMDAFFEILNDRIDESTMFDAIHNQLAGAFEGIGQIVAEAK